MSRLVLASTSPRRSRLLNEAGIDFAVRSPSSDEVLSGDPYAVAVGNARSKARSVDRSEDEIVLGADTIVVCDGSILGKPADRDDARRMLLLQLERPQEVITGICLVDGGSGREVHGYEASGCVMRGDPPSIERYLDSGCWRGKAGAYGIQDEGGVQVDLAWGDFDNVVGLPVTLLRRLLSLMGFQYPYMTPSEGP
jgi:septum formation protein